MPPAAPALQAGLSVLGGPQWEWIVDGAVEKTRVSAKTSPTMSSCFYPQRTCVPPKSKTKWTLGSVEEIEMLQEDLLDIATLRTKN